MGHRSLCRSSMTARAKACPETPETNKAKRGAVGGDWNLRRGIPPCGRVSPKETPGEPGASRSPSCIRPGLWDPSEEGYVGGTLCVGCGLGQVSSFDHQVA